jgi:hypothetical protein
VTIRPFVMSPGTRQHQHPERAMNPAAGRGPRGRARPRRMRALVPALTAALLLLAYAERLLVARIVLELVLRLGQIAS